VSAVTHGSRIALSVGIVMVAAGLLGAAVTTVPDSDEAGTLL
jgi:hypothetical protein